MTPERRAAETALTDRLADTLRKRAERQRRREAGEVRVEVWLDKPTQDRLKARMKALGPGYGYTTVPASILHMIRMDLGLESQ